MPSSISKTLKAASECHLVPSQFNSLFKGWLENLKTDVKLVRKSVSKQFRNRLKFSFENLQDHV